MAKPLLILPPLLFAGLATLFWVGMNRDNPDALPSALVGQVAPSVVVVPLGEGPIVTDAALRVPGVKLVNFWASWCAPCRAEHPILKQLADEGVQINGINYKDDPAKALSFLNELGNPFSAIGADASGRMALNWGLYGVPETFVIDGQGKVVLRYAGPLTQAILKDMVRPAMEKAASQ
ncbi:MAG: DsbE family thiol:disulfide interchange protein [Cereibacter sphaeroides]|uniref:DsbE family thiol:disulfide interchange protein n=1 Tax=Cereibacter sphaeroides TaxID=1063 RepID=A0A2W5SJ48_CERSP|nr:MAG: DsbE family thiol:disulfide interchange protein [Cereibacter sphaeroides]